MRPKGRDVNRNRCLLGLNDITFPSSARAETERRGRSVAAGQARRATQARRRALRRGAGDLMGSRS